jgi:DNA-binding transcriptional ArsR family regulator
MRFTKSDADLDALFSALAHPIRRALLAKLERGPATVGDLAAPFDVSLMAISKHLGVLERADLVRREIEGRSTRCSLVPDALSPIRSWLDDHSRFWTSQLDSFGEYVEQKRGKRKGGG